MVRYRPELAPGVVELQRHLWGTVPDLRERYLRWKHHENPCLREPHVYLALLGEQVVGMRSAYGATWEAGKPRTRFRMPVADDFVIHPDHRRTGLATLLMSALHEGLTALGDGHAVNLLGSPATVMSSLATGWKSAGSTEPLYRAGTGQGAVARLRARLARTPWVWRHAGALTGILERGARGPFARFDRESSRGAPRGLPIAGRRVARVEAMARLVERLPWDGRVRRVRDVETLSWIFGDPLQVSRVLYWGDGPLAGYLVLRSRLSEHADPTRVNIVDWEGETTEVLEGLLETALHWGAFPRMTAWSGALPRECAGILRRFGFAPPVHDPAARFRNHILVRALRPAEAGAEWQVGARNLLHADSWDVRMY